jgi:ribA/ribD-fused uncharacterized protein
MKSFKGVDNMFFKNNFYFLSNMFPCRVEYKGVAYSCAESAFQAQKDISKAETFATLNGYEAKRLGRRVNLRPDWDTVKLYIMYEIVTEKFRQNPALAKALLNTTGIRLVEDNTWNDKYWGKCNGVGENYLGRILMRVRRELNNSSEKF